MTDIIRILGLIAMYGGIIISAGVVIYVGWNYYLASKDVRNEQKAAKQDRERVLTETPLNTSGIAEEEGY